MNRRQLATGFTLAELLIALAILGVIATFTIPKVLQSQQDSKNNAIAKEAIATMANAYQMYRTTNKPNSSSSFMDLTPYLNYIKVRTTGTFDKLYGMTGTEPCGVDSPCYILANGALISSYIPYYGAGTGDIFGGTATTNYIYF